MRTALLLVVALLLATPAMAGFDGPGGPPPPPPPGWAPGGPPPGGPPPGGPGWGPPPGGPGMGPPVCYEAGQIWRAPRDTPCELEGFVFEEIGRDLFHFRDNSGRVVARIDPGAFRGHRVTPGIPVRIYGRVRHDRGRPEIEVDRLEIIH